IVEWMAPPAPHLTDFSSVPQANQGYEVAVRLAEMVERVELDRRLLVLKRFPTHFGNEERPAQLEGLATKGPSRSASAAEWMRRSRVAVISYPDTPFIEAMAIGVPTIGLWNPELWEMRDDA